MALTYGFYNAELKNGEFDRTYDAEDFGRLFEGLISDGVFKGFGDSFRVTKNSNTSIVVGTGKAWFNGTWSILSEPLVLSTVFSGSNPSVIAVILQVNKRQRFNSIKIRVFGNNLNLTNDAAAGVFEYCLAYVHLSSSGNVLSIESHIGQGGENVTPWVRSVLGTGGGTSSAFSDVSVYTTGVKFKGSSEFELSFKDTNGLAYMNKFKITEQNGKISKITNTNTGRSIAVSYE